MGKRTPTRSIPGGFSPSDFSGQQFFEEELCKPRVQTGPGIQSGNAHKRELTTYEEDPDGQAGVAN